MTSPLGSVCERLQRIQDLQRIKMYAAKREEMRLRLGDRLNEQHVFCDVSRFGDLESALILDTHVCSSRLRDTSSCRGLGCRYLCLHVAARLLVPLACGAGGHGYV